MDLPEDLLDDVAAFLKRFPKMIEDIEHLLDDNRIFKQRTVDIGIVSPEDALQICLTIHLKRERRSTGGGGGRRAVGGGRLPLSATRHMPRPAENKNFSPPRSYTASTPNFRYNFFDQSFAELCLCVFQSRDRSQSVTTSIVVRPSRNRKVTLQSSV